jgi:hypothetical protein
MFTLVREVSDDSQRIKLTHQHHKMQYPSHGFNDYTIIIIASSQANENK